MVVATMRVAAGLDLEPGLCTGNMPLVEVGLGKGKRGLVKRLLH